MNKIAQLPVQQIALATAAVAGPHTSQPVARASAQVLIQAPIERVWHLLTNVDGWPAWNRDVDAAALDGRFVPGSVFRWKSQGFGITSTVCAVEVNQRITWTGVALGTKAFHAWEVQATDAGVLVSTSESFHGWLAWLLRGMMQRKLDATLPRGLASLKAAAEGG